MLVFKKPCRRDATPNLPNVTLQSTQPVEYRLRWDPSHWDSHWPGRFHVVCVNFVCVGYPRVSGGIWALRESCNITYSDPNVARLNILHVDLKKYPMSPCQI